MSAGMDAIVKRTGSCLLHNGRRQDNDTTIGILMRYRRREIEDRRQFRLSW